MSRPYGITFRAMGSQFNVWLETDANGEAVLKQVPGWVEAIEARLTRFRPESELSRLNARSGKWVAVSDTLLQAILAARRAAWLTDGMCNPLVLPALVAAGYEHSFAEMQRGGLKDRRTTAAPDPGPGLAQHRDQAQTTPDPAGRWKPDRSGRHRQGLDRSPDRQSTRQLWSMSGGCGRRSGGRGRPYGEPGWLVDVSEPGEPKSFSARRIDPGERHSHRYQWDRLPALDARR